MTPDNFELTESEVGEPGAGEVLVRNVFMSVDPYMRGRMNDVKSYVPPFRIGDVLQASVVGQVVPDSAAERAGLATGDYVMAVNGERVTYWSEWVDVIEKNPRQTIVLDVRRGDSSITVQAVPDSRQQPDGSEMGFLGVGPAYVEVSYDPITAIRIGAHETKPEDAGGED